MIIDLTSAFNFLHHAWDILGVIILALTCLFLPIVVVLASAIKVKEHLKPKRN